MSRETHTTHLPPDTLRHVATQSDGRVGLKPEQVTVLKKMRELAADLLTRCPEELLTFYRDTTLTMKQVAARVFSPELVQQYPSAAMSAVRKAVSKLIPAVERNAIMRERIGRVSAALIAENPERHRKISADAARARFARGPAIDINALALGKGHVPWKEGEREKLLALASDPAYLHTQGSNVGKPDYAKIATVLNSLFHGGENIRNSARLSHVIASENYNKKKGRGRWRRESKD